MENFDNPVDKYVFLYTKHQKKMRELSSILKDENESFDITRDRFIKKGVNVGSIEKAINMLISEQKAEKRKHRQLKRKVRKSIGI